MSKLKTCPLIRLFRGERFKLTQDGDWLVVVKNEPRHAECNSISWEVLGHPGATVHNENPRTWVWIEDREEVKPAGPNIVTGTLRLSPFDGRALTIFGEKATLVRYEEKNATWMGEVFWLNGKPPSHTTLRGDTICSWEEQPEDTKMATEKILRVLDMVPDQRFKLTGDASGTIFVVCVHEARRVGGIIEAKIKPDDMKSRFTLWVDWNTEVAKV